MYQVAVDEPPSVQEQGLPATNSVLMIAYYFPPDGSAGVYRPLRFIRQLPRRGWHPAVVTLDTDAHPRPDPRLLAMVPDGVTVVRVSDRDVWKRIQARREDATRARLSSGDAEQAAQVRRAQHTPLRQACRRIIRALEGALYYPDHARFWIRPATSAVVALCRERRPTTIVATGGPWSAFVAAFEASRITGVPYVLDFRDSWTLTCNDDFERWRPRWAARRDRRLLRRLLTSARAIVVRYESEAESYWRAYAGAFDPARIHIIPNGYEGDVAPFRMAAGDRCTVLYTGTLTQYRYDTLLDALSYLRTHHPDAAAQLRLVFVGEGGEDLAEAVRRRGLASMVETRGPVPAHEVDRLHGEAHALLLLGVRPFRGYELVGSKVFGYLKAARPIVGILPRDETCNVLRAVRVRTVADIDNTAEIAATFMHLLRAWSQGALADLLPDRDACADFSSDRQAAAFVRALEGSTALRPFVPGRADVPSSLRATVGPSGWIG